MASSSHIVNDLHHLMEIVQQLDVGLIVLDRDFNIQLWNAYTQYRSGLSAGEVIGQSILTYLPKSEGHMLQRKLESARSLGIRTFVDAENLAGLFDSPGQYHLPLKEKSMNQVVSITPIKNIRGEIDSLCLLIHENDQSGRNHV